MKNLQKSFCLMTISSFFGALIPVSVKALSLHSSILIIFFLTRIFLLVGASPTILKQGKSLLKINKSRIIFISAVFYVAAMYCYFYSLLLVPLAISSLMANSAPLYVPLIALFILKDQSIKSKILWLCMLISFAGVALMLLPNEKIHYSFIGFLLAFLSGIFLALWQVCTKLVTAHESPHRITFLQTILSIVFSFFPAAFIVYQNGIHYLDALLSIKNILLLVLCGISSWIYQLYRAKAMIFAPVSFAMPIGYLGVVFVGTLDYIFWHTYPNALSIFGMLIVILGVILLLKLNKGESNVRAQNIKMPLRQS